MKPFKEQLRAEETHQSWKQYPIIVNWNNIIPDNLSAIKSIFNLKLDNIIIIKLYFGVSGLIVIRVRKK